MPNFLTGSTKNIEAAVRRLAITMSPYLPSVNFDDDHGSQIYRLSTSTRTPWYWILSASDLVSSFIASTIIGTPTADFLLTHFSNAFASGLVAVEKANHRGTWLMHPSISALLLRVMEGTVAGSGRANRLKLAAVTLVQRLRAVTAGKFLCGRAARLMRNNDSSAFTSLYFATLQPARSVFNL